MKLFFVQADLQSAIEIKLFIGSEDPHMMVRGICQSESQTLASINRG